MCGIVGTLLLDGRPGAVDGALLERMRDALRHRGPDGAGLWLSGDGRVGLGHRRLAIIDLSDAAAQPMASQDGALQLVFNGELYNHAELRRELTGLGRRRWVTDHSDTEVLLQAWQEWGVDCLPRLRGMFAFALWDARERALWLVRDRIGVKPLYWSRHHGKVSFASEIKALLEDPEQERAIDEEGLYHYLSFLTTPAPGTLFRGVRKLAGGTWLKLGADGREETRRWWDVWREVRPLTGIAEEDAAARVLETLREAVRLRKVSDVPVGVFLSGGIDSSSNAALFREGEGGPVKTFTVGYRGDYASYQNELDWARQMAAWAGTEHHERLLTQDDLLEFLPEMVRLQDEPIGDPVCVPVYYVSQLARQHGVIVCQVGEGADELFWGYPEWRRTLHLQERVDRLGLQGGLGLLGALGLRLTGRGRTRARERLERARRGQPIFWSGAESFTDAEKRALLSPELGRRLGGLTSWEAIRPLHDWFQAEAWDRSPLHWMTHVDLHLRLPELLLMRVDKMSMGVALEARVPFLDHAFVELALSLPAAMKTRGDELKHLLKRAVRGVIPDALIDRPKQGFGVPVLEWYRDRLGREARAPVEEMVRETGLFQPREVARLLDDPGRGPLSWQLLNLALWWRHYIRR